MDSKGKNRKYSFDEKKMTKKYTLKNDERIVLSTSQNKRNQLRIWPGEVKSVNQRPEHKRIGNNNKKEFKDGKFQFNSLTDMIKQLLMSCHMNIKL